MIKKLLVLMAASAIVAFASISVLGMIGGFEAMNRGPMGNWGPWADWGNNRYGRDPGPETTRDLAYAGSDQLNIGYPAEITVTQGPQTRFTVTGPQYILDQLRLENGTVLWDGWGQRGWGRRFRGRLRIDIVSPNLHEFHLSGAQELHLKNFDQDSLILHASGAADVEGQGKARRLEAHITGAGDLKLDDLTVDDALIMISGAGDARVDARKSSEVHISGAGNVSLKCRPPRVDVHKSGFGDVNYGSDCSTLPAEPAPPASTAPPAAPAAPAAPAPKSRI
ncbi:MAG: GIN domain-containing protein [Caulobacteraceae bacterium]